MSVPKRKKTPSKKKMKQNNKINIKPINLVDGKLPHHMSRDGYYKNRLVIDKSE